VTGPAKPGTPLKTVVYEVMTGRAVSITTVPIVPVTGSVDVSGAASPVTPLNTVVYDVTGGKAD